MLWIMGIVPVLQALFTLVYVPFWPNISANFDHTPWVGLHFWDTIFPLFIFIVGISMSLSIKRRLQRRESRARIYAHIIKRSLLLFLLGLVYNGLLDFDFASLGYCGVLQRIAIAYLFGSLIVLHTNVRTQAATAAGLLLSYWALMTFVPVPRFGPGVLTPGENLHAYIDRMVLPGRLYNRVFDEDGLLQQMSSISVALLGAVAGYWLGGPYSGKKKTVGFLAAGAVSICLGLIWHSLPRPIGFPMIFRLWSSSYVLVAVGYASVMLGLFYYIIDVKGYRKWAFPFVVIGLNPLTIYLVQELFDFGIVVNIFLHGVVDSLGSYRLLVVSTCVLGTKWLSCISCTKSGFSLVDRYIDNLQFPG